MTSETRRAKKRWARENRQGQGVGLLELQLKRGGE